MHERDMADALNWRYTQYSQFNDDGTMLLLSGVHQPSNNINGEIAIYLVDRKFTFRHLKFTLFYTGMNQCLHFRCRVMNKPYDVFGCWFDRMHILNGEHFPLANNAFFGTSASMIWLCKSSQDTHSERQGVLAPFFR